MKPAVVAIRAIGTRFANRLFYPVFWSTLAVAVALVGLSAWLVSEATLWLLLFIPVVMAVCIALGVLGVVKLMINYVTPQQTLDQKKAVKEYADKIQRVSEAAGTPKLVLLFHVVRDVAAPSKDGFIGSLAHDSKTLASDFADLVKAFRA